MTAQRWRWRRDDPLLPGGAHHGIDNTGDGPLVLLGILPNVNKRRCEKTDRRAVCFFTPAMVFLCLRRVTLSIATKVTKSAIQGEGFPPNAPCAFYDFAKQNRFSD